MKKGKIFGTLTAACVVTLMLLLIIPTAFADTDAITQSGNPNLYNAIVAAEPGADANSDNILQASELHNITGTLNLMHSGITDITGIQYCDQITELDLQNNGSANANDITVIPSDLSGLSSMSVLYLQDNADLNTCTTLSAIATIPKLYTLDIDNTGIKDVSFLTSGSALTQLHILTWDNDNLTTTDLATLTDKASKFPNLTSLAINSNTSLGNGAVSMVASAFPNLTILNMSICNLTDISGLSTMTHLTTLFLAKNSLTSLDGVQTLSNLSYLSVWNTTTLADISAVSNLHKLWYLDIQNAGPLTSISALSGLNSSLRTLSLFGDSNISDFTPLESLTNLTTLHLDYVYNFSDLTPLAGLTNLTSLTLIRDYVYDLSPIAGFKNCTIDLTENALDLSDTATTGYISTLTGNGCTVTSSPQKQFTVSYYVDPSKGTADKSQDTGLSYGQSITIPTVTPVNTVANTFSHWDKAGSGSAGNGETTPLTVSPFNNNNFDGTTYTATYTAVFNAVHYSVSYDANGATGGSAPVDSNVYATGDTVTVAGSGSMVKTGSTFGGWTSTAFSGTKNAGDTFTMPSSLVTLYAVWQPNNAKLFDPGITGGTLVGTFKDTKISYNVHMTEAQDTITFAPVAENSNARVYVGKTLITNAAPSKSISIDYNANKPIQIKVKYGKSTRIYTFTVHRPKCTYSLLNSLTAYVGGSPVGFSVKDDPATPVTFDPNNNTYYVYVAENVTHVTVKATAVSGKHETVSPKSETVSLQYGQTKTVVIKVKPQLGKKNPYTVYIKRAACSNADLKYLKISLPASQIFPQFDKDTTSYTVTVPYPKTSVTLYIGTAGYKATAVIDNTTAGVTTTKSYMTITPTPGGSATVDITVTAQDGTKKIYEVTVNCP